MTNAAGEAARVAVLPEIGDPTQNSCADHDIWHAAVNEAPALPWPSLPACPGTPGASASTCSLSITPSQATRAEGTDQAISVSVQCPFSAITPFVSQATGSATLTLKPDGDGEAAVLMHRRTTSRQRGVSMFEFALIAPFVRFRYVV